MRNTLSDYELVIPDIVTRFPLCFKEHIFEEWPEGWKSLIENMLAELTTYIQSKIEPPAHPFAILQIKEKFGALTVYAAYQDEGHRAILSKYYTLSTHTCMYCAKEGNIEKTNGWLRSVCPKHSLAWKYVIERESAYSDRYKSFRGKVPKQFYNIRDNIFTIFEKHYDDSTETLNEITFNEELEVFFKAEELI
jgi:hypothetical protein